MSEVEAAVSGEGEQSPLPFKWQNETYDSEEDEIFWLVNYRAGAGWTHRLAEGEAQALNARIEEIQKKHRSKKFFYRIGKQPVPSYVDGPAIVDLVAEDLYKRKEFGIEKYGQPLKAHNGRNPLQDAYEEAMDLVLYLRQCLEEQASVNE